MRTKAFKLENINILHYIVSHTIAPLEILADSIVFFSLKIEIIQCKLFNDNLQWAVICSREFEDQSDSNFRFIHKSDRQNQIL